MRASRARNGLSHAWSTVLGVGSDDTTTAPEHSPDVTARPTATSHDVRAELESLLERDLLGPWDGPNEELPPGTPPAERYLLGRLIPRPGRTRAVGTPLEVGDADLVDREVADAASDEEEPEPQATVRAGTMAASSLGLSFTVPADAEVLRVTVAWGAYERARSEFHTTPQGRPAGVWRRRPVEATVEVDLDADCTVIAEPTFERVELRVTSRLRGQRRVVDLALVNAQPVPTEATDTARLYQVRLSVTAADGGAAVFVAANDPDLTEPPSAADPERLALALLFRGEREFASGRQCAVDAQVRPGELRAWRLSTTSFPAAEVRLTVPAGPGDMPGVILDMATLGSDDLARNDLIRGLRPLVDGYRTWLDGQAARADADPEVARFGPAAGQMVATARGLSDRLDRAVDLLRDDPTARDAFCFANRAMADQRVRSEVTRIRLAEPHRGLVEVLAEVDVPARRTWRPFQLAFVLLCIPGLTDPAHPDAGRGPGAEGQAQLLFFPTGGGKTESYLGLTAYTFAIRRLQGVVGTGVEARDGTDGVAVLMRYTLRLLTAQQFARAAALTCACELLRRRAMASGDGRWGATPCRVGLWVGSKVTPNTFDEAQRLVEDNRDRGGTGGVLQLAACPWCGSRLSGADLRTDRARRRVLVFCSDPEGDCPFTPRRAPDEGIPVITVDEELYRLTPALVVATVDKFAQLPWKAATATLFGLVDERCSRHGWRNPDFDGFCRTRHPATANLTATAPEAAMRLRPPDLIIQDELHLIADALGSMVGLYETAIDRFATRTHGSRTVRPMLVASTATVRRAVDQVEQVFDRSLAVFPTQVIDAGETFFSRSVAPTTSTPARRYRGILATGERITAIEIRVVAAVMEHAQYLFDRHGAAADPYMTLVDYFTSTRDLAGMRRLVDDDIADRLNSRAVRTRRRRPTVAELTSRMASDRIGATLATLDSGFDPSYDTTAALEEFRAQLKAGQPLRARPDGVGQPLDVLLATSMLQVGVDVPRLGLMVVTGQPKNTAEYIQATSRVGRDPARPGLIFTIYQWTRPRDLGHLEHFGHYHATFGSLVEGLTTTPFSDRAIDRGLTGVVVAALRHSSTDALANTAAQHVPLDAASVEAILDGIRARAERVTHDPAAASTIRDQARGRLEWWSERRRSLASGVLGYKMGNDVTGLLKNPQAADWDTWTAPMSLREVEPEVLLQLARTDPSVDDAPPWHYDEPAAGDQ